MSTSNETEVHLQDAIDAFGRGDLDAVSVAAHRLVDFDDHPFGHRLLGDLAYLAEDPHESRRQYEAAFRGFRDRGDLCSAARSAIKVAELHDESFGNRAAAQGWLERARRTLDQVGPCVEWGYLELAMLACFRPDAIDLQASADRALAIATEFGDHDLEVRALADGGLALVTQGHLPEGFARLDEAMAALTAGEVHDPAIAGRSFCALLTSCDRVGDVARADEWVRVVNDVALAPMGGRPRALQSHCRVVYGSVLATAGRWTEAEDTILQVLSPPPSASVGHLIESTCHLAGVRIEQGRLEEAASLLAPYEDHYAACEPLARLHLRTGEPALAAAVARRGLRELAGDALRCAPLLARLIEAELAAGNLDAAADAARELADLVAPVDSPVLGAEAAIGVGRVRCAQGDVPSAIGSFEAAAQHLTAGGRPLLAATARMELAEALTLADERAAAIGEARAAAAIFERLGARTGSDRAAALLRRLGAAAPARSRENRERAVESLSRREAEVLVLIREGCSNADIAARLFISPKTAEHHVSRVLAKLGVRTRAEAAALAATLPTAP
jgi:DNA-binding CsgD family transcriptional regulator